MDKIQKLRQIQVVLLIVCVLGRRCSTNVNFTHLKCSGLAKIVLMREFWKGEMQKPPQERRFSYGRISGYRENTHLKCSFIQPSQNAQKFSVIWPPLKRLHKLVMQAKLVTWCCRL